MTRATRLPDYYQALGKLIKRRTVNTMENYNVIARMTEIFVIAIRSNDRCLSSNVNSVSALTVAEHRLTCKL